MKKHIKLLFLGSSGVGKTSLIRRWTRPDDMYCEPTFAIDVTSHSIRLKNNLYRIRLSDTSGKEYYDRMLNGYIYNSDAILLVYDTTNRDTWEKSKEWTNIIFKNAGARMPVFLIGNKIDRESKRCIYREDVQEFIHKSPLNRLTMVECSAKTGEMASDVYKLILSSLDITEREVWMEINRPNENGCNIV
jgi:small GTP-binding protein